MTYKELKKVFDAFVEIGIYLPKYHVHKIAADDMFDIKNVQTYITYHPKLKWYTDKDKAAYSLNYENWLDQVKTPVVAISLKTGKKRTFNSLYQAAKTIGKQKGFGNIHMAIQRCGNAYGYKWEYSN